MPPTTPLIIADNLFDFTLYPTATLTDSSELTGREAYRIIDARRERSWWQAATSATSHFVQVDLGAGIAANADAIWFDRGHNMAGRQIQIDYSDNGSAWTTLRTLTFPAAGVVGGDPTLTTMSATEEGVSWALFTAAAAAHRHWRFLLLGAAYQPVIPGVMLGVRAQLIGYSRVKDEDSMNRTEVQEMSRAGYLGTDRRYAWRTVAIDLNYIGATEYDSTIRTLRRQLFELDQPFFCAMDYGTKPQWGWLYRWDGTRYSASQNRTYRANVITGREVGPLIR